jgi:hypothetical protein
MGLAFYYEGKLRDPHQTDDLKKEVKDICISMNWPYQLWPLEPSNKSDIKNLHHPNIYDLRGISFTPENCETVWLTFLPDGRLISPVYFIFSNAKKPEGLDFYLFTKTQYAGVTTHLAIMKLLIYLDKNYFEELKVTDEGKYWETRDESILQKQFKIYNDLMDIVSDALSNIKISPGESAESIADKIENRLNKL